MAWAYQNRVLSGDTHGIGILITGTTSAGADIIHTALASTTEGEGDQVWLWADNPDVTAHVLKIWWGGTTAVTNEKTYVIPGLTSDVPLMRGRLIRNGLVVKASCDVANKVSVGGHANRILTA
jgi:hypothetical protein